MRRILYAIVFVLFAISSIDAQCTCTNCPLNIPNNAIVTSTIDVSGLINGTLGSGGQAICEVRLNFLSDAIEEVDVKLTTPSGQMITLIPRISGIGINQNLTFDISFVQCAATAVPDAGYPAVFNSNAYDQASNQSFNGSYYPGDGQCLEGLTGDANGTYTLTIEDFVGGDPHTFLDWEIIFCDGTGLSCTAGPSCAPGEIISQNPGGITAPEGDPSLLLNYFTINWGAGGPPDPALYGITYTIQDQNNNVLERANILDLTSYPPGTYFVCAVSYLLADEPLLPPLSGGYSGSQILNDILNGVYCADRADICSTVTITSSCQPGDLTQVSNVQTTFCQGDPGLLLNALNNTWNGSPPDPTLYSLTYYVEELTTGIDVTQSLTPDLSSLAPGQYSVCGVSYLTADAALLPSIPNVDLTALQQDIDNDVICADISDFCLIITIENNIPAPVVQWPNPTDICEGVVYNIPITDFDPSLNYVVSITSGSFSLFSFDNATGIISVNANAGIPLTLCVTTLGNCSGTNCETFNVLPGATVPQFSGPTNICPGNSGTVNITNAQPGDVFNWTISGPGTIDNTTPTSVDFTATGTGTIVLCADITGSCGQVQECFSINSNPIPPPSTNALASYCVGFHLFNGVGNGPFTSILWEQISGPGTITFISPNTSTTPWTVDLPGTYVVRLTKDLNGCIAFEEVTIQVVDGPTVTGVVTCANGQFTVELTFSGGTPPYSVFGSPITGNVYTSPPYPSGSAVLTTYEDASGCQGDFFAQEFCNCTSDAGTMSSSLIELCDETLTASGIHNADATFDGDDVGQYVLHTNPGASLGAVIDINNTGDFVFQAPMTFGTVYYISYIVGTDDGSGQVDLNDNCLSVSAGQPVVWYPVITIDIGLLNDPVPCDLSVILEASNDTPTGLNPTISWSLLTGPPGGTAVFLNGSSQVTTVDFNLPGSYTIEVEFTLGSCIYTDQYNLLVEQGIVISNILEVCDPTSGTYEVSFDISGGVAPYVVDGVQITGTSFISLPINIGSTYSFDVGDSGGCPNQLVSGSDNCGCISDAGSMPFGPLLLCIDEEASSTVVNPILDGNDNGIYILHDNPGANLGTILDENATGIFTAVPQVNPGQSYYISYVVGNSLGTSVDFNDQCLSVAVGTEVVWYDFPTLSLPSNIESCGGLETISIGATNALNFNWDYSAVSPQFDGTINSNDPRNIQFSQGSPGLHILKVTASNEACTLSDSLEVFVNEPILVSNLVEECNGLEYTVTFEISGGLPPYSVNGSAIQGTVFTSIALQSGTGYTFSVLDANGCTIPDITGSKNCNCNGDAGTMPTQPISVCGLDTPVSSEVAPGTPVLENEDKGYYILHDASGTSIGNIFATSDDGQFTFQPTMLPDSTYFISYVVGDSLADGRIDFNDPCFDLAVGTPVIWYEDFDASFQSTISACDLITTIDLDTLLSDVIYTVSVIEGAALANSTIGSQEIALEFQAEGRYVIEINGAKGPCIDRDTIIIDIDSPQDLSFFEDSLVCGVVYSLPTSIGGEEVIITSLDGEVNIDSTMGVWNIQSDSLVIVSLEINTSNSSCPSVDTINVELVPPIEISTSYTCDDTLQTAEVIVEVSGGRNSYLINGELVAPGSYAYANVAIDSYFKFEVTDETCNSITDSIFIDCGCVNSPASLSQDVLLVCEDEQIEADLIDAGQLGIGDQLEYILHTGSRSTIGSILSRSQDSNFTIDNSWPRLDTLWLVAVIGPQFNGQVDLTDPCTTFGNGQPIYILPELIIEFESPIDLCLNDQTEFEITVSEYVFPITIEVLIGIELITLEVTEAGVQRIPYVLQDSSTNIEISAQNILCGGMSINETITAADCSCDVYDYEDNYAFCYQDNEIDLVSLEANSRVATFRLLSGDGTITNNSSLVINNQYSGRLVVEATPVDVRACDSIYQILIDVSPLPVIDFITDEIELCGNAEGIVNLDDYISNVQGNWLEGNEVNIEDLSIGNQTFTYTIPGTSICPEITDQIQIIKTAPLQYTLNTVDPECFGEEGTLIIDVEQLSQVNQVFINNELISQLSEISVQAGQYNVEIIDTNNCRYEEQVIINEPEELQATLLSEVQQFESNVFIITSNVSGGSPAYDIQWFINGTLVDSIESPYRIMIEEDTDVSIEVVDQNGCLSSANIELVYQEVFSDVAWTMPDIIRIGSSTNGRLRIPSFNDISYVQSWNIYDRWGNNVFRAGEFDPRTEIIEWNGSFNGTSVSPGVYVYRIQYERSDGTLETIFGEVTVVR